MREFLFYGTAAVVFVFRIVFALYCLVMVNRRRSGIALKVAEFSGSLTKIFSEGRVGDFD